MDGGTGVVFGVERVGARRVYACTSIESGVEGKVERIPRWNMEGTRDAFKHDESVIHRSRRSEGAVPADARGGGYYKVTGIRSRRSLTPTHSL